MKVVSPHQWEPLRLYIAAVLHTIGEWENFLLHKDVDWLRPDHISSWLQRLKSSLSIIEGFYMYDDLQSVSISKENSGFPTRRHFDLLVHKKQAQEPAQISVQQAKSQYLDALFSSRTSNIESLENVSNARAYERLKLEDIYEPFRLVDVIERQSPTPDRSAYVCVWERFTDKPVLYVMLFEANKDWLPSDTMLTDLSESLQHATSHELELDAIARTIDIADARIYPKWVSRIILGPMWITGVTTGDHIFQHLVDQVAENVQYCASRIVYEYVFSEREAEVDHVRDANGNKHSYVQSFVVHPEKIHYTRGVTRTEETFFMPHDVVQKLGNEQHVTMGHQLVTIERRKNEQSN